MKTQRKAPSPFSAAGMETSARTPPEDSPTTPKRSLSAPNLRESLSARFPGTAPDRPYSRSSSGSSFQVAIPSSSSPALSGPPAAPHVAIDIAEEVSQFGSDAGSLESSHSSHLDRESGDASPSAMARFKAKSKTFVFTGLKIYTSFLAISSAIKIGSNPKDMVTAPLGFFESLVTGAPRADGLQVQDSRDAVVKQYGNYIDVGTRCVNPTITFVHNLKNQGQRDLGLYDRFDPDSNKPHADRIRLDTYNLYLPSTAVHEYLHCYTHPNFTQAIYNSDIRLRKQLVEGTTEYLTRKVPVTSNGDTLHAIRNGYSDYVKLVDRVVNDVGEETLKRAYFSGDQTAMVQVLVSAYDHAGLDKNQG